MPFPTSHSTTARPILTELDAGPAFVVTAGGDWEGLRTFDELELLGAGPGMVLR